MTDVRVTIGAARGLDGDDGREIEIRNSGTYIQWRYVGDTPWTNLVALSTLTGATGATGMNPMGVYDPLEEYIINDAVTHNGSFYLCKLASTGNNPNNVTYWTKYVSEGDVAAFLASREVFADNASALSGGLEVGDTYLRTGGLVAVVV